MDEDLAFLSVRELGQRYRTGSLSPVRATEYFLRRIERLDPQLKAFVRLCPDRAQAEASAAESLLNNRTCLREMVNCPVRQAPKAYAISG